MLGPEILAMINGR